VYPLEVHFCEDCHHAQLLDIISPEELFGEYVYASGTSAVFREHFARYAGVVAVRHPLTSQDLVVDIGSNDGTLLRCFKSMHCRVLGVDPAREISKRATLDGIETIHGFFIPEMSREIRKAHGPAKLVTANNVFAHIDDLRGVLEGVRGLLTPDGVFVFEVSYLVDVLEKTLFDTIYHEHLSYHTVGPLARFFDANGMELIAADRVDSHGGSLRGFVQLKGGPNVVAASVNARLAEEEAMGLNKPEALTQFSSQISDVSDSVMNLLTELKEQGARVAGYGAPAKATTLLYHFGIEPEALDYIVDDSPLKQGLLTPGLHIPVVPVTTLESEPVDCLVIFAWNFAESIMKKLNSFKAGGGQFLVPLPSPSLQ